MNAPIVITCAGRSGSKWLLRILDLHPNTLCRNEPHRISPELNVPGHPEWSAIAARAGRSIGAYDPCPQVRKVYVYRTSRLLGLEWLTYRRSAKKLFGLYPEGEYPWFLGSSWRVSAARPVLKIINATDTILWLLENRPDIPIMHIVRHPGGVLNSWLRRFVSERSFERVMENQRDVLRQILKKDPGYGAHFGDLAELTIAEAKLWSWRYAQEAIFQAGKGRTNYRMIVYEDLAQHPVFNSKTTFHHVGLDWPDGIEGRIKSICAGSNEIASKWRDQLAPEHQTAVCNVLLGSSLRDCWDVGLHDAPSRPL